MKATPYKATFLSVLAMMLLVLGGCQSDAKPKAVERPREYSFWPSAPDEPHIQFLTAYNSSADIVPAQSHMDEMLYGRPQILAITKPYGVAMWHGRIYVCDVRSRGITVLDLKQRVAKAVGVGGATEIVKAIDIAIAPDGMKYVVDGGSKAIVVLDAEDHTDTKFAPKDFDPVSVAVYGNELFVADFTGQKIRVLDRSTGKELRTIGEAGSEDGQFVRPLTVRVDPAGIVSVVDVLRCRVQRFSQDGKFINGFGQVGNLPGDMVRPKHMALDKNGYTYLVDSGFNNVQVFDETQRVVGYFGSAGGHPGSMDMPVGIYVDESPEDLAMFQQYVHPAFEAERLILVTNQFGNQRVSVYAGGHLKPGKTVADIAASRSRVSTGLIPATRATTRPDFMPEAPGQQSPGNSQMPARPVQ